MTDTMNRASVRAPGRVNLIGEHIDYCGLPVLPMAIQRGIAIEVVRRADRQVILRNTDGEFEDRRFELSTKIPRARGGDWSNYLRAAAQAAASRGATVGAELLVRSDLPAAAGLSSSSALVVAGALALLWAAELVADPLELAEQLALAERYVGLAGGGMDQAVCLNGRQGHALRVEFAPLSVALQRLPDHWRFLVAHSTVTARKSSDNSAAYNERAESCRLALRQMALSLSLPEEISYGELIERFGTAELVALAGRALEPPLDMRFRHVVSEAQRVAQAVAAIERRDLRGFGELMVGSHTSLRDDYRVSCRELDELVDQAMALGAAGARLTGAGFGGAALVLTDDQGIDDLVTGLGETFYRPRGLRDLSRLLFEVSPSGGAFIVPGG